MNNERHAQILNALLELRIGEMIERVRELVDRGLTWLVDRAVSAGTSFMNMLRGGGTDEEENANSPEKQALIDAGVDAIRTEEARYAQNGKISRENAARVAASIRQDHSVFNSFDVIDGGDLRKADVRPIVQPGVAGAERNLPVRQRVLIDVDLAKSVGIGNVPILGDADFVPEGAFSRLEMMRPKEKPLAPMYSLIFH